jgi:hypothetical protein
MLSALLVAAAPAPLPVGALPTEAFEQLLETGNRQELVSGCRRAINLGLDQRLAALRTALLDLNQATSSLDVLFADTEALIACKAPDAALQVLARISPDEGPERQRWLLLQWRAASAGLDQRRAALALKRFAQGSAQVLNNQQLTLQEPQSPGELPLQRSALDVQAAQLEATGDAIAALELLQTPGATPLLTAQRNQQAAALLAAAGNADRAAVLAGFSIDLAAAEEAWGLSESLLDDQRRYQLSAADEIGAEQTNARRLRLSRRLADSMAERTAVLAAIADQTVNPVLAQELIDRRDPLERRSGALLDVLVSLDPSISESPTERLARLDLAVVVAQRLGHRERLMDLLMVQEREARIQEKSWLRDRITQLAVEQAKGNPLRELKALYRRQRQLLEEPQFETNIWLELDPKVKDLQLERLQRQEEKQQRLEQRWAFDPFPGSFSLPQVLEDRARLQLAQANAGSWLLPPAEFGDLPSILNADEYEEERQKLELVFDSLELSVDEREQGPALFSALASKLQRREALEQRLQEELVYAELDSDAVARRAEWLQLEQALDPDGPLLRQLAGFGRSEAGLATLRQLHAEEDWRRQWKRHQELQAFAEQEPLLQDKLNFDVPSEWQREATLRPSERVAMEITESWQSFRSAPSELTAAALQMSAQDTGQDAVELDALRFRLALVLPSGTADPALVERLQVLELRLRSPQSRDGHLGPSSPSR